MLWLDMNYRFIGSGLPNRLSRQVRAKVECQVTIAVVRLRTLQLPESSPQELRVATHSKQVSSFVLEERVLHLCRGTIGVFYNPC